MKKATTIEEIYNVFAPEKYLQKEDKEFYVNLYGIDFKRFVIALKNNQITNKSFFIAGQSGNGKSTVLNLLTTNYPDVTTNYEFNYIAGRTIFLYEDIDIVDILLMIGNTLTKNNQTLKEKYFKKLKTLEDIKDGSLEESSLNSDVSNEDLNIKVKIGVGARFLSILKASVDFESSYRINEEIRKDARRFFKIKRKELIDLTNEIINEYKISNNTTKDLIIVIDDLEKKDNIDKLFLRDMPILNELNIIKIITMPIHLHRNETFPNADVREFGLKLKTYDGDENQKDKDLLKDVILKRLEDKSLITNEAVDLAIEYSGANLRQLIRLIHLGAEEALTYETPIIDIKEIEEAIQRIQLAYSSKVMNMKTFLYEIMQTKGYEDNDENLVNIAKATKMELVFANFNGIVWYEINPVVNEPLKRYINNDNKVLKLELKKKNSIEQNKYIYNIEINDYFSIKKILLENLKDKKEIYFVGENGDGKTIVLQALALAYKDKNNFPILADKYIKNIKNKYKFNILNEDRYINNNLYAYGINRNKTDADDTDESGYSGLFDMPSLKNTTSLNRPEELFILDTPLVNIFKEKLEQLLENKIKIQHENNQTKFLESDKEIEFRTLSEGYKSTIIWLCDLLFRLIKNQSEIDKLEEFKAVVLVDEIDLYLHPKWKYKFMYDLRKIFPEIQFIMTTHSMTTILGSSKDAVFYKVYKDEEGFTQLSEQINDISDYSANILATSPIFDMKSAKSRAYNNKMNNLSDDDYDKYQLNKKIDDILLNDNDETKKLDILKQLEEYNEGN